MTPQERHFFEVKIRPLLVKHCYRCHSNRIEQPRAGLRLDSRDGLLQGSDSGKVVVPGQPEKSLLLIVLQREQLRMPLGGELSRQAIKDIEAWIRMGVPDPRSGAAEIDEPTGEGPGVEGGLWSFEPVISPELPVVSRADWPLTDVDRFILARLDSERLAPVANAEPRRLIRRIYLDMIGLPPTPDELQRWLARFDNSSPGRHSRSLNKVVWRELVDELLASPQFGERWARHWLDTARYAESNGNNRNRVLRYAWRYRNWVIDAINADKPYDQFLREQVAGDLMPFTSREDRAQKRIATGFLAVGAKPYYPTIVPFDPEEPDRARFDWAAEQINATMTGMLGLTVGCARCHDHKFDPIPTRDYYALAGIFRSTNPRFGMFWDLFGVDEGQAQRDFLYDWNLLVLNDEILDEIKPLQERYKPLVIEQNRIDLRSRHWPKQIDRMRERLRQEENLPPEEVNRLQQQIAERQQQLDADAERLVEVLRVKQEMQDSFTYTVDQAMGVEDADQPADVHVRIAGEHARRGELVPRGFLSAAKFAGAPESINSSQSGRLELAEWIAHPNNPLTARVAVNRIWYHLFGRGLVNTLDNFGSTGEMPSHPELLDHLAYLFVHEFGWSQKQLIRYLMTSRVYQLNSAESQAQPAHFEQDPENIFYWRMSPRRLEAEAIRDCMLFVTGRLQSARPEGSPVVDFDYYADIRHEDREKALEMLRGDLRTIYVPTLRGHRNQLYELFDYPDDEAVNSARNSSSVPTQALFLINSTLVMDYAQALVERLDDEGLANNEPRLKRLYQLCYGRSPTGDEIAADVAFLDEQREVTNERQAWRRLAHSILISGEFLLRL